MKKVLAYALLIVCTFLVFSTFAFGAVNLVLLLSIFGVTLSATIAATVTFVLDVLQRVFKQNFGLSAPKFILLAYLPSV